MTSQGAGVPRVLIVDDENRNRDLLSRLIAGEGWEIASAVDGADALDAIARHPPDLILLDVVMPGIDGFEVCRRTKANPATRLIPIVLVTGLKERDQRIAGINAGADDFLSKPIDPQELSARVRSLLRLKQYTDELDSAESVILSLALTVEARDRYTDGHCRRLAAYATSLGGALGLSGEELAALRRGAILHDVGKIGIPDAILHKPAALTADEMAVMRTHPVIGERLCGSLKSLRPVRPLVKHHHERLDGSGYPDGLRGDAVPLLAEIVGIADTFDAITTTRPYRVARSRDAAYRELASDAAHGLWHADLVETFIRLGHDGLLAAEGERTEAES
jgi:putative two-component system response regulator